jgi:hypothetical protein
MPRERIALIGLGALLVLALIFGGIASNVAAGQQSAWMEGYTMGRLTAAAGVDGAVAPMVPYAAPYAAPYGGYAARGPGFGGFLFLLLGAGALFFVFSRFARMARYGAWMAAQGGPQGGTQGPWQGGPQGDWRHGPPWMHRPWGCGGPGQQEQATGQAQAQGQAQEQTGSRVDTQAPTEQPQVER